MLRGMEEGRYVLRFPDILSTWICAGLGGTSELCLPVIVTALVAPLVVSPVCHQTLRLETIVHEYWPELSRSHKLVPSRCRLKHDQQACTYRVVKFRGSFLSLQNTAP